MPTINPPQKIFKGQDPIPCPPPDLLENEPGRVRARRLFSAGIKDIGDVKAADSTTLARILGQAVAADLKKQVGQEINAPDSKTELKGQTNLADYP